MDRINFEQTYFEFWREHLTSNEAILPGNIMKFVKAGGIERWYVTGFEPPNLLTYW